MTRYVLAVAVIGCASFAMPASSAALLGANVSEQYYFPDLSSPYPDVVYTPQAFTIGAGQESTAVIEGVTTFNVDFSDLALNLIWDTTLANPTWATSAFNGLVFTSPAFSNVSGVTVNGSTNLAGFDGSRVSIVGDELRLNWSGLSYDTNTVVALDFSSAAIPEPSAWAMMILGLGFVGAAFRRRPKARVSFAF